MDHEAVEYRRGPQGPRRIGMVRFTPGTARPADVLLILRGGKPKLRRRLPADPDLLDPCALIIPLRTLRGGKDKPA